MRRPSSDGPRTTRKPLRRKPKQLTESPHLYVASGGGPTGSVVVQGAGSRAAGPKSGSPTRHGAVVSVFTDERGELLDVPTDGAGLDPEAHARARQIAARLGVRRPRRDPSGRRGIGELASLRYRGGSDEIDLDRTLDVLTERPVPEDDDIIVRERVRTRRSVVLLLDASGSMKGERIRTAAATVGALAGELDHDDLGVVAFWSDAAVLLPLGDALSPIRLLDTLLRIPARGLTNVTFALETASRQLRRRPAQDARVVLLSDCVHNAGPDPRPVAARLPRLDVLLDVTGESDEDLGAELASLGRGRFRRLRSHRDVAPAVSAVFGG